MKNIRRKLHLILSLTQDIIYACCLLQVMADTRFLYNIQNFPKDNINAETVDLMMPYLNYHMYTYEAAKQACGNVAGLIQWTISMVAFYEINKDVLPLKVFSINKHYCEIYESSRCHSMACIINGRNALYLIK